MRNLLSLIAIATVSAVMFAAPVQAGDAGSTYYEFTPDYSHSVETPATAYALNGQLALGGLSGGVGNTFGSFCCSGGGGFFVVTGSTRRGGSENGDIAFRQARDAAFGQSIGGPAIDRAFRFRANRIQRSGF